MHISGRELTGVYRPQQGVQEVGYLRQILVVHGPPPSRPARVRTVPTREIAAPRCQTRRSHRDPAAPLRVIAYSRVSTGHQADSGTGLDTQRATLEAEVARRGWTDVEYVVDARVSGGTLEWNGLTAALAHLDAGQADVLIATKIDRVCRSVVGFASVLEESRKHRWTLVVLDVATEGPAGEFAANVVAAAAQYEHSLASQRTKDGLAARKASGVRLGRPSSIPTEITKRIVRERTEGRSMRLIAEGLTADGVPTARGGAQWKVPTIQSVLRGQDAAAVTP